MRPLLLLPLAFLPGCERHEAVPAVPPVVVEVPVAGPVIGPDDLLDSVVRISTTQQAWDPAEPWQKNNPGQRRALGAIVGDQLVLTTSEMAADATYIEFESSDGKRLAPAKVIAVDYEANLALLGPQSEEDAKFFEGTEPLEIAEPPKPGDALEIVQLETNGTPLVTSGNIQSIDVVSNFLPGQYFLTYEVKASMQSSANSFSLPVMRGDKLAGILTSYNSKDQISDVTATDIVSRFVKEAADGEYSGFPSLGIAITRTEDLNFRLWLKLPEDDGGLYISSVRPGSAAEKAGLKKGDVIVSIDGHTIDRLGYFDDPHYGRLYWSHLVRGAKASGDKAVFGILRDGQPQEVEAVLDRLEESDQLVPAYTFGQAPSYLVKGGLIFQELTRPLLQSFGKEWQSRAPLKLLDVYENPEKYESRARRVVFLANVIPTPATVGYEPLRNLIVNRVNGKEIKDMATLIEAFDTPSEDGMHRIEFEDEKFSVYLDETISTAVDEQLIQRGLNRLSRAEN
ncbi:S1C family serine protease [Luteolibacter marinus]|uniref:S1C family serine protease n=1 Tax=Luteolibacter marinus TaxID=2776705 RepID=UPI001868C3EC|nr:PDZ domain-containing protein [Luteolibacter marinus]